MTGVIVGMSPIKSNGIRLNYLRSLLATSQGVYTLQLNTGRVQHFSFQCLFTDRCFSGQIHHNRHTHCFGNNRLIEVRNQFPITVSNLSGELWQCRFFSGRPRRTRDDTPKLLSNDVLIKKLLADRNLISGDSLEIRLIQESTNPEDKKPTTTVMSLTDAVRKSIEVRKDLVEVNIAQEVPIIRLTELSSFLYHHSKKIAETKKSAKVVPPKEVQFRSGIADGDLRRKVDQVIEHFANGYNCVVKLRSSRHGGIETTLEIVSDHLKEFGEQISEPKYNEQKTQVQLTFRPKKKTK